MLAPCDKNTYLGLRKGKETEKNIGLENFSHFHFTRIKYQNLKINKCKSIIKA